MVKIPKPTLPYIADEQLPRDAAEAQRIAGTVLGHAAKIQRVIQDMQDQYSREVQLLKQVYQVVDRLRKAATDAQNYVDRALSISHTFVPLIENAYPCTGADFARNSAHSLHLWIGLAKDVIGNPPGGAGGSVIGQGDKAASELGRGAADLLAEMERSLGKLAGEGAGQMHAMLPVGEQGMPVQAFAFCLASTTFCRHGSHYPGAPWLVSLGARQRHRHAVMELAAFL